MSAPLLDETHDPALQSWVESANTAGTDFPIQNLPLGVFRRAGSSEPLRAGVAIGDQVLDLSMAADADAIAAEVAALLRADANGGLNTFMAAGQPARVALRRALSLALTQGSSLQAALTAALVPQVQAEMALPCRIGDYTDFYASIHHATKIGTLFRPDNPLLPNYKWVPIGYHGRASSIGVSGQQVRRPLGQMKRPQDDGPHFGPCQRLDYELELAAFVSRPNAQGSPVPITQAEDHLFGMALFNDWSARDIQAWEYQPLGPFLSKNFASTLSPWIVTLEALAPFRAPWTRASGDPQPLPYLDSPGTRDRGGFDIQLEVLLQTPRMREAGLAAQRLTRSNFNEAYWTVAQMLAHHTVGGCNLQAGDLLGSGTMSGPSADQGGSLQELSLGGTRPLILANGETRRFLEDGDSVVMRGRCERAGFRSIGFGDCEGRVLPSIARA